MTPTPDAWTMLALAGPMVALFFAAVGIGFLLDRRRAKREPDLRVGRARRRPGLAPLTSRVDGVEAAGERAGSVCWSTRPRARDAGRRTATGRGCGWSATGTTCST